jgi:hypothetical protein
MGSHDDYGKQVLRSASRGMVEDWGPPVEIYYHAGHAARIDGVVDRNIAVEVESRVSKQVRGAVLDLLFHSCPKKLLILLPVHMSDVQATAAQCRYILSRWVNPADFRVVTLSGTGSAPELDTDIVTVQNALRELGFSIDHATTIGGSS